VSGTFRDVTDSTFIIVSGTFRDVTDRTFIIVSGTFRDVIDRAFIIVSGTFQDTKVSSSQIYQQQMSVFPTSVAGAIRPHLLYKG